MIIDRRGKYMQNFVFDPSYIHGQWKQSFRLVWYRENIVISNRLPRKMIFTPVPIPYRGFQIALFTVNEGIEWGGGREKKLVAAVASIPNGGNGRLNVGYHAAENIETPGRPLVCIERWRRSRFRRSISPPLSPVNTLGNDRPLWWNDSHL